MRVLDAGWTAVPIKVIRMSDGFGQPANRVDSERHEAGQCVHTIQPDLCRTDPGQSAPKDNGQENRGEGARRWVGAQEGGG